MIYLLLLLVCNINIIDVSNFFSHSTVDKYGLYLTSNVPTRGGFINAIVASVRFI